MPVAPRDEEWLKPVDRIICNALERIFGLNFEGSRNVYFHSQCLNEDSNYIRRLGLGEKDFPVHGRCWLNWTKPNRRHNSLEFCWDLLSDSFGIGIDTNTCERHLSGRAQIPPFSFFLTLESDTAHKIANWISEHNKSPHGSMYGPTHFEVLGFRIHDNAFWFDLWHDGDGWSSRDAKWKRLHINIPDKLLGRQKYTSELVSEHDVVIPMPEGKYPAHVKLTKDSWKRPRWPFPMVLRRYDVKMVIPIPHEGKGENSWDCGEDALFGQGGVGECLEDAISGVVNSVLNSRRRYNGDINAKYPAPKMCHEKCKKCQSKDHYNCASKKCKCWHEHKPRVPERDAACEEVKGDM